MSNFLVKEFIRRYSVVCKLSGNILTNLVLHKHCQLVNVSSKVCFQ